MIDILGFIGSISLTCCAVPQAWKSYKDGHSDGISKSSACLWLLGLALLVPYVFIKYQFSEPWLLMNYSFNLISISIIFKYRFWKRK